MRLGRGDLRGLLLASLLDGPAHGYQLMRRFEEASGGQWTPSPGSVYPTLQLLVDEGLLTCALEGGKKTYALNDAGRADAVKAASTPPPWSDGASSDRYPLRDITHAVHAAAKQVGQSGSPAQIEAAVALMKDTKRSLYLLLAGDVT